MRVAEFGLDSMGRSDNLCDCGGNIGEKYCINAN